MMIKYVLFGTFLLLNTSPSLAQVGPAGNTPPSHYACTYDTKTGFVNLRSKPNASSNRITKLQSGTVLFYISEVKGNDGFIWYQVRTSNNVIGWVRSDYACRNN